MLNDEEEKLYTLRYIISGLPPYVANHTVLCTEPLTLSYGGMEHLELFRKQNRRINKVLCSRTLSNPKITSAKVDQIDDEVLESIDSILPGIDSFDAESNLIEYLLHRDTSINDSQKIDSLLDEFASFSPSPIPVKDSDSLIEEIDIFLDGDGSIPPGIESDDFDSEDDDNSTSLPEFESFHVDYPDSGDSTINVVEDIPVDVPNILPTHPTIHMDFDSIPSHNDLRSDLDISSPSEDRNKIYDPGICIEVESTRIFLV
ncbi:hypothetical protein Tco_0090163 [Tanacetum coccineum]